MADVHIRMTGELKRLLKANSAHRGESMTDAITRLTWWYVDGTDDLMLDGIEQALEQAKAAWEAVGNHPSASEREDVEFYACILGRANMRMAGAAEQEE